MTVDRRQQRRGAHAQSAPRPNRMRSGYATRPSHATSPGYATGSDHATRPSHSAGTKRGRFSPAVIVVIAAVIIAAFLLTRSCAPTQYQSPYNWDQLSWTAVEGYVDERPAYTSKTGTVTSKLGIDVSDQNGDIDWSAVANDGIDFAIIRAGWRGYSVGNVNEDTRFVENIRAAAAAGLQVGCYFYSSAITVEEAQEEARLTLEMLQEANVSLDFPVVFDHEPAAHVDGRASSLDSKTATDIANAFCEVVEAAGYRTMIYGNASDLARFDSSVTKNRPVWLASYDVEHPEADFDFSIWQYTGSGSVAGIDTDVDMSIWFTQEVPL